MLVKRGVSTVLLAVGAACEAGAVCVCSEHDAKRGVSAVLLAAGAAYAADAMHVCSKRDARRGISTMLIAAGATVVVNTAFTSPDLARDRRRQGIGKHLVHVQRGILRRACTPCRLQCLRR